MVVNRDFILHSQIPRGHHASERGVQLFNAKPSTDSRESVAYYTVGITSLKRVVRLIPGVVKTPDLYRSESVQCTRLLLQR